MPGLKPTLNYQDFAGTIRACSPAETLAKLTPLYPHLGITRIADISHLDILGLPVVSAVRPLSKNLAISLGKGISIELAEISAVMESIEGYHAENLPPPTLIGSYVDLQQQGFAVIDPLPFMKGVLQHPSLQTLDLAWIEAEIVPTGKTAYLPQTLCNLDLASARPESYYFQVSSNGIAAGNTLAEATCHALYELIERDAFYAFGQLPEAERQSRRLNLDSISSEAFRSLWSKIKTKNMSLKIWDMSHHMEVPGFHACLYDDSLLSPIYLSSGSGSHLSREVALLRAVTEAIQCRTALISGARDDIYPNYYLYQQNLLRERSQGPETLSLTRDWQDCIDPTFAMSFEENETDLIRRIGGTIYRVNLTQSKFNIPVVFTLAADLNFTGIRI